MYIFVFFPPRFLFRNARATVLQRLQQRPAVGTQCGHVQVLRSGNSRRNRPQRGHNGTGILHDAQSKFEPPVANLHINDTT